ncbi:WXG100 family type VII secretion target [Actinopolyspora saharensis]|uniref:WXG100 family type VII secretion target n=1 Tax=Actinopolyspora saharensis TaxID=995062 RepID=A0A1H0YRJ5_9ACTN|nr:hypothetical protein [Actinopolyspora saharensis]SDQ17486.1 hypothetical protein SAMN04489718_0616 [Actinopolyspora saharensis]
MTSETYLDVPGTENAGRRLSQAVEEFKGALQDLQYALDRDHGCWSDDEIGKQFESSYLEPADKSRQALRKLQNSLEELATAGLPNAVRNIQQLDTSYGEMMQRYEHRIEEYQAGMRGHMLTANETTQHDTDKPQVSPREHTLTPNETTQHDATS